MSHETRVAAGLKAAIHNPKVSEEAKERAEERLHSMESGAPPPSTDKAVDAEGHEVNRVLGGYKATLHNPNVGEAAKKHAREILEADGYTTEAPEGVSPDDHQVRVNAGYKSALHNPNVSPEAKKHAKEYLKQHGGL